ncbi:MAG: hypothetical protein CFE21_19535 [Bacteroidetes bacterium B1(2017)]|nr:MAG: hypothetical protein CFE21_19535 [Bacteroidetes bacterium B1(2017)]
MEKSLPFDPILYNMEQYYNDNLDVFNKISQDLYNEIYSPLIFEKSNTISKKTISKLIVERIEYSENKLNDICQKHDMDFWMSFIRRYPNILFLENSKNWKAIVQLAILKYSSLTNTNVLGRTKGDNVYNLVLTALEDDYIEIYKIGLISSFIGNLYTINRGITKGGSLCYIGNNVNVFSDDQLSEAFKSYDERIPVSFILSYTGVPVSQNDNNKFQYYMLYSFVNPIPLQCTQLNYTLKLMNHDLKVMDITPLKRMLQTYDDAIYDIYGISHESIIQFLYGLSQNVNNTLPRLSNNGNNLVYPYSIDDKENFHKLTFYFSLCLKGYLRFPTQTLIESISNYPYPGISIDNAKQLTQDFINTFSKPFKEREQIDIGNLTDYPFIYTTEETCYVDFVFLENFIGGVVQKCKNWFTSQHGDRFTLLVKKYIELNVPNINVIFNNSSIIEQSFVDIIIIQNDTVFCIECKAYAKSVEYLKGNIDSFNSRNQRIKKAVEQAITNLDKVKKNKEFAMYTKFEWIVCTSSQEFLNPVNKYGMLTKSIPKVCTVEELIVFFNSTNSLLL